MRITGQLVEAATGTQVWADRQTAIALDGDNPEVLWVTSQVIAFGVGDLKGAIASLNKAIYLNPNCADAIGWLGVLVVYTGDTQSAIAYLERATSRAYINKGRPPRCRSRK